MSIWQDATGALKDDMDGVALALPGWPSGMSKLTDAQVAAARAPTLAEAQAIALADLAAEFAENCAADVLDSNGMIWSGGLQSALSIDGATRLASAGGSTSIDIFDASNTGHSLTIVQANAVAAAIGATYQSVFGKYQVYKVAISSATTTGAVAAAVAAATWS